MSVVNFVLIGYKSSGKTTVGKALAKLLGYRFVDLDSEIEKSYESKFGGQKSFREIFQESEELFRKLEKTSLTNLINMQNIVLATGGSTPLNKDNRKKLSMIGVIVWVNTDEETLYKRIINKEIPAFFDPDDLKGSFDRMIGQRKEIYNNIADFKIMNDSDAASVAAQIKGLI